MFDPKSTSLIESTPDLLDLDRGNLAKTFSEAFAKISSARIRLRTLDEDGAGETLNGVISSMRRLARTNEALVIVQTDRENRAAAAFVAGTAHQLVFKAEQLRGHGGRQSMLASSCISSDISAVLLFLIAEATADACEATAHFIWNESNPVNSAVIKSIKALAKGELLSIVNMDTPALNYTDGESIADYAVTALYFRVFTTIQSLAKQLLGKSESVDLYDTFQGLRKLCSSEAINIATDIDAVQVASFPGPFHLISLLMVLSRELKKSSVIEIILPEGLNEQEWRESLKRIAVDRPYLWRNHREAINQGYLNVGVSSVVSFPTGAGKSTLSELKINVALQSRVKVIFLAPTLALVDQTSRSLSKTFPNTQVNREQSDPILIGFSEDEGAQILVLTPEACLAQMSFDREAFNNVGLVVFDECHLLHPSDRSANRRPIDAMLCLLNLIRLADNVDVMLLSAMMENTDELAGWIEELTSRRCLSLSLFWKPTRQIRGCIVYDESELERIKCELKQQKKTATTQNVPALVRRKVGARPQCFFSLKQTWETKNADDYSLQPLLDQEVLLGVGQSKNKKWYLTPNSGVISAEISAASPKAGIKTLIFFQTIQNANAAVNKVNTAFGNVQIKLTSDERALYAAVVEEFGSSKALYLDSQDGFINGIASTHHGRLLSEERKLVESLYKRSDGISVLCATPTLAQGMNLPSEMVIIAEDSRYDVNLDKRKTLEAQEILNAAGRAGRAGMIANGMVLVVPGKVVGINIKDKKKTIGDHWSELLTIFGQSDQCLTIDDPLTAVMDRIHDGISDEYNDAEYCVSRLLITGSEDSVSDLGNIVSSSFAGFRARRAENQNWVDTRKIAVIRFAEEEGFSSESELDTAQHMAALFGFPVLVVKSLEAFLAKCTDISNANVQTGIDLLFDWMSEDILAFTTIFKQETLGSMFGKTFKDLKCNKKRRCMALPKLRGLCHLWTNGSPLVDMEEDFTEKKVDGPDKCKVSRLFVLQCIPSLSYAFSLPAKLMERHKETAEEPIEISPTITYLPRCVRAGFNSLELLATQQCLTDKTLTRRQVHQQFEALRFLEQSDASENFDMILDRVKRALMLQSS